jgi:membrane protein DedA with SNARE-associated domain
LPPVGGRPARTPYFSFIGLLGAYAPLAGVLAALLIAGLGFPIPEDLSLLTAGYFFWQGDYPLWLVWSVCLFGILAGDCMLYALGRKFGVRITQHRFLSHALTPPRLERVRGYFQRHGEKTLLVARGVPGARAFFFLTAGTMRMVFWRFLLFDAIAASVATSFWIFIGWRFGPHIDRVRHVVSRVEHVAAFVVFAILSAWVVHRLIRRRVSGPPTSSETL